MTGDLQALEFKNNANWLVYAYFLVAKLYKYRRGKIWAGRRWDIFWAVV